MQSLAGPPVTEHTLCHRVDTTHNTEYRIPVPILLCAILIGVVSPSSSVPGHSTVLCPHPRLCQAKHPAPSAAPSSTARCGRWLPGPDVGDKTDRGDSAQCQISCGRAVNMSGYRVWYGVACGLRANDQLAELCGVQFRFGPPGDVLDGGDTGPRGHLHRSKGSLHQGSLHQASSQVGEKSSLRAPETQVRIAPQAAHGYSR